MQSRREILKALGVAGAALALPARAWSQQPGQGASEQLVLEVQVFGTGQYHYLDFDVPAGANRVAASYETSGSASLGIGLFDERGPGYQTAGFRGVYGAERRECFVAAHEASQSFTPGPIRPGRWTVLLAVFEARQPTNVTVTVELGFGPQGQALPLAGSPGVVRDRPGWYRGDLHCHTPESSDAWASGTALSPPEWADECRRIGLDYASMTDHNVVSQNLHLARDAGRDVLLIAGEEMTNWFHGHATVAGLEPGDWLDWRQRPQGIPLQEHEARLTDFLHTAREMGTYVAAAHPFFANLAWQFFGDAAADPRALPDGIEVWTAQWRPDCETALQYWHGLLEQGHRVFANGGSDLHGVENDLGFFAGTPTTVVYAERLETGAIVDGLRGGRSFMTRLPDGVEIYLTARGPGDQHQIVGGTVYGSGGDVVRVEALVRKGAGMRLHLYAPTIPAQTVPVTADEETHTFDVPIGPGGFVRAEVRSEPFFNPAQPLGSRMDMEAFTNPIFLVNGPEPDDNEPVFAPPEDAPPAEAEPQPDPHREPAPAASLPATGAGAAQVVGGAAAVAAAMTLSEVVHRAGTGATLRDRAVRVAGEVTALNADGDNGAATITRWTPDCCGREDGSTVHVRILGALPPGLRLGDWVAVDGTWVDGSGAGHRETPALGARRVEVLAAPLPRRDSC